MLDDDALADVEGDADWMRRQHRIDDDAPVPIALLCRRVTGRPPLHAADLVDEAARWTDGTRTTIYVHPRAPRLRQKFKVAHELGHVLYDGRGLGGVELEARCDAFAAALVAPRRATTRFLREVGERPTQLAKRLDIAPSVALLRIGEVSRRPVALLRLRADLAPLIRGEAFGWPANLVELVKRPPRTVLHPVGLTDEGQRRTGLMALRAA